MAPNRTALDRMTVLYAALLSVQPAPRHNHYPSAQENRELNRHRKARKHKRKIVQKSRRRNRN